MSAKTIDKAIRETPTFQQKFDAAQGNVLNANTVLRASDIIKIKAQVEDATGLKIIRAGRPDAVTAKHVRGVLLDAVQRSFIVKVGA